MEIRDETLLAFTGAARRASAGEIRRGLEAALKEMAEKGEIRILVTEEPTEIGARVVDRHGSVWEKMAVGWRSGLIRCEWDHAQATAPLWRVR